MRRGPWVMVAAAICVVVAALVFHRLDGGTDYNRYHQHLEQPSEAELEPCAVHGGADAGSGGDLCTHLPIITIATGGQKIPGYPIANENGLTVGYETGAEGEEEILVEVAAVAQAGVWHHPDDAPSEQGTALMRIRGNSSRWFSKSSYKLTFVEDDDPTSNVKLGMLGMNPGSEWALYGPFLDKTLLRNYMWMNLSAEIMGTYTPDVRFCELVVDGEYRGVYVLMETIDVDRLRLNLTPYSAGDPAASYLARIEPYVDGEKELKTFDGYTFRLETGKHVELVYPGLLNQTEEVRDYVESDLNAIEKTLNSLEMYNGQGLWQSQIDVESFVNYYLVMELLANNDTFSASTYLYRDVRGKLHIGPVWDFNNALDNFIVPMPRRGFLLSQRGWFAQLMADEDFVERVIARWRELRSGILSDGALDAYIDGTVAWLGNAVDRNFEVWGWSFDPDQLSTRERRRPEKGSDLTIYDLNPKTYGQAVRTMRSYLIDRAQWMDEHIESLRQYCHPSKLAPKISE